MIEATETTPSYASTQIALPTAIATRLQAIGRRIPDDQLADDGRETDPHITVKYGLEAGTDVEVLRALLADEPPLRVTLGKTSIFPNGESDSGDVVKVDVHSPDLHRLNQKIADAVPTTDTYPAYVPHATIAYVQAGQGEQYAEDATLDGDTFTIDRVTFCSADGETIDLPLTGRARSGAEEQAEEWFRTKRGTFRAPSGAERQLRAKQEKAAARRSAAEASVDADAT
jgi:2'-5' RNA ligase